MSNAKNVFVLDPVNSNYPLQLGKSIARQLGGKCFLVSINPGAFIYGVGMGVEVIRFNADDNTSYDAIRNLNITELSNLIDDFSNLEDSCILKKCYSFLESISSKYNPAIVICYNDLRLSSQLLKKVYSGKIPVVFLELGPFRGRTTSFDSEGCNARSLFSSMLHENNSQEYKDFNELSDLLIPSRKSILSKKWFFNSQFLIYLIHQKLSVLCNDYRYLLAHREIDAFYYIKRFFKNKSGNSGWRWGSGDLKIYVPLQLEFDTQFQTNTCFKKNQDFIDYIIGSFSSDKVEIIFRTHPLDVKCYFFRECESISLTNAEALEWADKIVTINSTVGFEALAMNKEVYCFSASFYTSLRGVNIVDPSAFKTAVLCDSKPDFDITPIAKMCLHGDLYSFNNDQIEKSSEIIINQLL